VRARRCCAAWRLVPRASPTCPHDAPAIDGYNAQSMVHLGPGGAFAAEVVLTFLFVLVVLRATSYIASAGRISEGLVGAGRSMASLTRRT